MQLYSFSRSGRHSFLMFDYWTCEHFRACNIHRPSTMVFSLVLRLLGASAIGKIWYFSSFLIIWYCILVSKLPWSNCSSFWSLIAFINSVWNLLLPGALSSFIQIFPHNYFHNLQKHLQNISSQEALLVFCLRNTGKKKSLSFYVTFKITVNTKEYFFQHTNPMQHYRLWDKNCWYIIKFMLFWTTESLW